MHTLSELNLLRNKILSPNLEISDEKTHFSSFKYKYLAYVSVYLQSIMKTSNIPVHFQVQEVMMYEGLCTLNTFS